MFDNLAKLKKLGNRKFNATGFVLCVCVCGGGGFFLPGKGNLRRSDFDDSNLFQS